MKRLTTFILCLIFPTVFFAQDTLVISNGNIIAGQIIESDSNLISYKGSESSNNEIQLIPKSDILLIKHSDGIVEKNYSNDTLVTMDGNQVFCKILEIAPELITCYAYSGIIGLPIIYPASSVFMIHFHDGSKEVIDHEKATAEVSSLSKKDTYEMGYTDAKKYYNASSAFGGAMVSGVFTWVVFVGVIPGAIIFASKPTKIHNAKNPNNDLLNSDPNYREGFMDSATKMKRAKAAEGYIAGIFVPVAIVMGAIALN